MNVSNVKFALLSVLIMKFALPSVSIMKFFITKCVHFFHETEIHVTNLAKSVMTWCGTVRHLKTRDCEQVDNET